MQKFAFESSFASTLSPNSVRMTVGQSQTFTSVHGGIGSFTYVWRLNGLPAPGEPTGSTWTFTPTTAGVYTVTLDVKDSLGVHSVSSANVIVNQPPSLQIIVHCPVNIMVSDSSGHREGADASGHTYNEIAGASYTGAGSDPQVITLPGTKHRRIHSSSIRHGKRTLHRNSHQHRPPVAQRWERQLGAELSAKEKQTAPHSP